MASIFGNNVVYPRWNVMVWELDSSDSDTCATIRTIDVFDTEKEAITLYEKIQINSSGKLGSIVEAIVRFDDGEECFDIRQKDELGELM